MSLTRVASLVLAGTLAFALGPAASAAELSVTDPAGDNATPGLDIVAAELQNTDYSLAGTVGFRDDRDGTLIVGLKARERGLVRLVVRHRLKTATRGFLVNSRDERIPCDALVVRWRAASFTAAFKVPSTCLWRGNYGAVRPGILTEPLDSGADVDLIRARTMGYIARG